MAKCDEGYICEVCGKDVESIVDSDLYLRYVLGMVDPEVLHIEKERHIRCNPALAQFIVDDNFDEVVVPGPSSKTELDPQFVEQRENDVTAAWYRLKEVVKSDIPIIEYPLSGLQRGRRR